MSVYKQPEKSRFWQYDFRFKGRRFHGSTGCEGKRAAEAVVRKLRQDAALGLLSDGSQLTVDQAVGKWWAEVGKDLRDGQRGPEGASVLEVRLNNLIQLLGPATRLAEIRQPQVATAMEKRRGQGFSRSPKKGATVYYPSNATVNRDVINTLREILGRASTHWGAEGLPKIDWGELRLEEPRPSARLYAPDQVERWMDEATRTGWYKGQTARPDAADRAGVKAGRLLHGGRHHAGTTFQRKHGDRKLTQRLLGHLDAKSTDIYVHLDDGDLRQALESSAAPKSRNSPGPGAVKTRKRKRVMGL